MAAPDKEEVAISAPDVYRFKVPVNFAGEVISEVTLRANGRAMKGFTVDTRADGGVVFEAYRFAELGLRLANQPHAIVDLMHPADQFGLGMVALGFFTLGPGTGKSASP